MAGTQTGFSFIFVGLCSELRFILLASGSVVWIGCLRAFVLFCFVLFCFVVVLLVVQCAKQSFLLAGRGFPHIVYWFFV